MNGAGSTGADATSKFSTRETQFIAYHPQQWSISLDIDRAGSAIYVQGYSHNISLAPIKSGALRKLRQQIGILSDLEVTSN
jgi:hypothetical protein